MMKKDLIVIGTYCPDLERQKILNNCIDSLQKGRDKYDILICSHTFIPEYIHEKVDYVFYDKNNDILTDMEYLNQPWFSPENGYVIKSTFIGNGSTYLSVYRVLISALGISKTYGYSKVHYIEYDSIWNDLTPIDKNSEHLNEYDSVIIKKTPEDYGDNLYWGQGFFMSFKVDSLDKDFLIFNRDNLLKILLDSESKTNEKITEDILNRNDSKVLILNYDEVNPFDNQYKLSNDTQKESLSGWSVPYYNSDNDKIYVVCWNDRYEHNLSSSFIINSEKVISFKNISKFEWSIEEVGLIDEVKSIVTMVNGDLKNKLIFTEDFKNKFKKTNYITFK